MASLRSEMVKPQRFVQDWDHGLNPCLNHQLLLLTLSQILLDLGFLCTAWRNIWAKGAVQICIQPFLCFNSQPQIQPFIQKEPLCRARENLPWVTIPKVFTWSAVLLYPFMMSIWPTHVSSGPFAYQMCLRDKNIFFFVKDQNISNQIHMKSLARLRFHTSDPTWMIS